jgi:peptidyl-dipeptidase A
MSTADRLNELVADHVRKRAPLEREARVASWELATRGDARWEAESQRLETELKRLLSDREAFARLDRLREAGDVGGETARRTLEVLHREHLQNQTDPALLERMVALEVRAEGIFANFRPELDGRPVSENDVRRLLRDSDDVAVRRRAWEASKELGPSMAPLVRELVELRNRAARGLGFRDHYAMSLELQEIDESFLFGLLEELERLTEQPHRELLAELYGRLGKRFGTTPDGVRPWHLADPFFQEAVPPGDLDAGRFYADADLVALSRRAMEAMGFDVTAVLERSDLHPRPGKNQHAFCTHVDRTGDDVRVLCNITPDEHWMDTMLHELGHAVYDLGLARDLPWLLREAAHTLSTEAIALLFGRLATNPDWMIRQAGAPAAEIDEMRPGLARLQRSKQLLFPRWVMVMAHFERALYADPSADLGRLWWDLVERFQKVPRPEGRSAPDWACKVHVALAPVYYHNYLLGDLMASQLERFLAQELGTPFWFERRETAALLTERLFRHGAVRPWNEALAHATGSGLDPAAYVEQYVTTAT